MLQLTRRKRGQEGQALVETTFMILAVLLLLMGIIEFGFIFYAYVRVSNATREGARTGSLWLMHPHYSTLCEQVEEGVWSEVPAIQQITITLKEGDVVCPGDSGNSLDPQAGEPITVTATYDYPLPVVSALPIIRDVMPSPFRVARTVVMRFQ